VNEHVFVEMLTPEEIQERIAAILAKHPEVEPYRIDCCSGCCEDEVRSEHGWSAANAWSELQGLRWLAGDD
jgi:hypothetical protein